MGKSKHMTEKPETDLSIAREALDDAQGRLDAALASHGGAAVLVETCRDVRDRYRAAPEEIEATQAPEARPMNDRRKLICLDVDGVVHGYQSGWKGADQMPDDPVPGAMEAIRTYVGRFRVALYSSRSGQPGGLVAMRHWLHMHLMRSLGAAEGARVYDLVEWPTSKPPAVATLDDRAIQFRGRWPEPEDLDAFRPWDKGGNRALLINLPEDALLDELSRRGLRYVRDFDPDGHCISGDDLLREIMSDVRNADSVMERLRDGGFDLIRVEDAYPEAEEGKS